MKKYKVSILIFSVAIVALSVTFFVLRQTAPELIPLGSSDYNPKYADAIQLNKPELCQDIKYALQSSPTDSIDKVYGHHAIELCKSQAELGYFGCKCDSDTVLNDMRKH